jgi:hypothetical protein
MGITVKDYTERHLNRAKDVHFLIECIHDGISNSIQESKSTKKTKLKKIDKHLCLLLDLFEDLIKAYEKEMK